MRLRYVIVAVLLVIAGIGGFSVTASWKDKEQRELAPHKENYSRQADELLSRFEGLSYLSPEEQLKLLKDGAQYGTKWKAEQKLRLKADLEELAVGEKRPGDFADFVYGENWRQEVEKYKKKKELNELTVTASTLSLSAGAVILMIGVCRWITNLINRLPILHSRLNRTLSETILSGSQSAEVKEVDEVNEEDCELEPQNYGLDSQDCGLESRESKLKPEVADQADAVEDCDSQDCNNQQTKQPVGGNGQKYSQMSFGQIQNAFDSQAQNLKQKTKEFELSIKGIESAALENIGAADNKLTDLSEQICAIREYAAQQQERVNKLQEGYDWNIIRNFCLRIIRCIDNLDGQIRSLADDINVTQQLEQSKQELVFALESSGVEQFEVPLQSDYRGQEKHLEVLKDRVEANDSQLSGKIAEVVRMGYQYVIDEENVKIVRPAQVRLYN
jgi:molecular chaperone GrpE (heat shock protein)